jgi:excisionase family DNA binding protein
MTEVTTTTTYTLSQVAKLTGFSYEHIYIHVQRGKLPTTRDEGRHHVVQQADLDRVYPVEDRAARIEKFEADRAAEWERNRLAALAPAPTPTAVAVVAPARRSTPEVEILNMRIENLKEHLEDVKKSRDDWRRYAQNLSDRLHRMIDKK